jgi:hypothetical protein
MAQLEPTASGMKSTTINTLSRTHVKIDRKNEALQNVQNDKIENVAGLV